MVRHDPPLRMLVPLLLCRTSRYLGILTGAVLVFLIVSVQSPLANNRLELANPVQKKNQKPKQEPTPIPVPQPKLSYDPKPPSVPEISPSTAEPSPTPLPTGAKTPFAKLELEPIDDIDYLPMVSKINTSLSSLSSKVYAWYLGGESHLERDEFDLAAQRFSEVIDLCPEFAEVRLKRAESYANLNQLDQAQRDLNDFTRLSPNKAEAAEKSLEIAQRFEASGAAGGGNRRIVEALLDYEKGLMFAGPSKELTARMLLAIADLFYAQQNYTRALESYNKAAGLAPQDPNVLVRLMAAKGLLARPPQNFTQNDCETLSRLPVTPFSDLVCNAVKKELERLATPVKPVDLRHIFDEDEVTERAQIIDQPLAEYTKDARNQKISGTIELSVVLPASGREVIVIDVLKELPSVNLVEAAKAAARLIKFKPARFNSVNVAQRKVLVYSYPPAPTADKATQPRP